MQTWAEFDRVTSDLNRLAQAVPEHVITGDSWEQWLLYLREDAKEFLTAPDRRKARTLERTLRTWKKNHQGATGLLRSQQTARLQMSSYAIRAVRRLAEDVDVYLNDRALRSLREESPRVLASFNVFMPAAYSAALTATFVGAAPLRHPNMLFHETREDFQTHYNNNFQRPGMFPASGVLAFCTPVYPQYPDADQLLARVAPENRVIELPPDFAIDSVGHELLHWVTHQQYEDDSGAYRDFRNKVIIEGVTEYFSRVIYPTRANYQDELDVVQRVIADHRVTDAALRSAYFAGTGVTNVLRELSAAADEALARGAAEQRMRDMAHWRAQLTRQKNKARAIDLSRGLWDFLQTLSDLEIDTLAQGSGVTPEYVQRVKGWVAAARARPAP